MTRPTNGKLTGKLLICTPPSWPWQLRQMALDRRVSVGKLIRDALVEKYGFTYPQPQPTRE